MIPTSMAGHVLAEARRRWSVHPLSTFTSAVVFPALMMAVLFYLPSVGIQGRSLELRPVAVEVEGASPGEVPAWAAPAVAGLRDQPVYALRIQPGAEAAFEGGEASAAVVLSRGEGGAIRAEVHRRDDLASQLLVDALAAVDAAGRLPRLIPAGGRDAGADAARGNLARAGLFILLGFGWFFVSAGVIERLVSERERRSLECLLSTPVDEGRLVRGRLLELCLHSSLPQLACAAALVGLGFPPSALTVPLLVMAGLYPLALACFTLLQGTEDMVSASWKTGVGFMFAFPLLILISDVLGPLSPFYRISAALTGPVAWEVYLPTLSALALLTGACWALTPAAARRWRI